MLKAVIADDSSIMRDRLRAYLKAAECQVVGIATSANEAYKLCRELKPDLVTLDIMMPPGDGKTTALRIRKEKLVPVVLVATSNSQDAFMAQLTEAGIYTIKKPFTMERFVKKIKAITAWQQ